MKKKCKKLIKEVCGGLGIICVFLGFMGMSMFIAKLIGAVPSIILICVGLVLKGIDSIL